VSGSPMRVVDKENPYKNVERLKDKMRQHGAVFMKTEEVFDLPAQNIIEIKVQTTREYRKFQRNQIIQIDGVELIGDTTLSKRIYSRMLCGHYNADKLNAFRDLLTSTNDRLIIFYNYDAELDALKQIAVELEKPISEINGHTKDLTAYEQNGDSITLIQYKAGAMGLNLQKANKVIYFTLTDEAELFLQSMKRIHRIGQERPCFYYLMLCENSIEDEEILPTLGIRKGYTDELFKS
jgi:SNF2 family DNA or RNA helicase